MESYLGKCLSSLLLEESLMNLIEVIVINDGSTDSSSEIAHQFEAKYPEVFKVIDKANANYGSCINKGLSAVKGKYVKVLDSDDSFDTYCFEKYVKFLNEVDVDLVLNDYCTVDLQGEIINKYNYNINNTKIYKLKEICDEKRFPVNATIAYKTCIFENLNYFQSENIFYTDQEWIFHPMSRVNSVVFFNECLYKYLIGREAQSVNPNIRRRSVIHSQEGVLKMIRLYNENDGFSDSYTPYFDNIIYSRINFIYKFYLLKSDIKMYDDLEEFDKSLKLSSQKFYSMTNNLSLHRSFPIKYVDAWRNNNIVLLFVSRLLYNFVSCLSDIRHKLSFLMFCV